MCRNPSYNLNSDLSTRRLIVFDHRYPAKA